MTRQQQQQQQQFFGKTINSFIQDLSTFRLQTFLGGEIFVDIYVGLVAINLLEGSSRLDHAQPKSDG